MSTATDDDNEVRQTSSFEAQGFNSSYLMHEYALTKSIVGIAVRAVQEHNAKSVTAISLVIGETSGVAAESVQMYFDILAEGTPAEGAGLKVRVIKPEMHCPRCGRNFVRPRFSFACPICGVLGNPTDIGKEFYVDSVELETGS